MNSTNIFSPQKDILFEDNHLIIVNKPPTIIVQGDKTGDVTLIDIVKEYVKKKYLKKGDVFLGLVHRLDRPVSGIVIFARTSKALARMNEIFKTRSIDKKYWAITKNGPPENEGKLIHFIKKDSAKNKSFTYNYEVPESKRAELTYKIIGHSESFYLWEITLLTGRHHQIRAQLSAINCPIKGDLKYGFPRSNENAAIDLHAAYISFTHPVKKEKIEVSAPPPATKVWSLF
ncbi:MAG: RluA family pseudouridine synthase [Bacteroidales bacterium]|nr:RluA family pseudouridine synthase [Bacteroidales bacterium]